MSLRTGELQVHYSADEDDKNIPFYSLSVQDRQDWKQDKAFQGKLIIYALKYVKPQYT